MQITIDRLLTAKESAGILTISLPTFYRLLKQGRIPPAVRVGTYPRWPESEIAGVIEAAKLKRAA